MLFFALYHAHQLSFTPKLAICYNQTTLTLTIELKRFVRSALSCLFARPVRYFSSRVVADRCAFHVHYFVVKAAYSMRLSRQITMITTFVDPLFYIYTFCLLTCLIYELLCDYTLFYLWKLVDNWSLLVYLINRLEGMLFWYYYYEAKTMLFYSYNNG